MLNFLKKFKLDKSFFKTIKKLLTDDLIDGHYLHWICMIIILMISFTGNCYQIYHAVQDLSKNISDIDITYPLNYSVPSITICFPVIAILNTNCLRRKNSLIIQQLNNKYPNYRGKNLLKELYSEIIKNDDQIRLILNGFLLKDLYRCLDKPKVDMTNDKFQILKLKHKAKESFKSDLFCYTFNFNKKFINKFQLLEKRIMKSFLELRLSTESLKYVDHIKFFLHDAEDEQNDYLLWYYKLINLNITEKDYKNYFGFSYLHYSNILEEKCIPNGKVAYHYTTKTFSTTSHLQEDCINKDFVSILKYPYGDSRLPVEFLKEFPKFKIKLFRPDREAFEALNIQHNFSLKIDNCLKMTTQKACVTSIFVPLLKYSFTKDDNITFLLIPPAEPDLEVKSAPRLSTFEFSVFIISVITCWLQFSLFGLVYSLITIKKSLNQIKSNLEEKKELK